MGGKNIFVNKMLNNMLEWNVSPQICFKMDQRLWRFPNTKQHSVLVRDEPSTLHIIHLFINTNQTYEYVSCLALFPIILNYFINNNMFFKRIAVIVAPT